MAKIESRPMRPEDTQELLQIKRQVFGVRRVDEDVWTHLRYGQPWPSLPGVVCTVDGRLAGALSTISRKVKLGGRTTLSAQHVDAMVLPEARGHSLYKRMVNEASRLDREAGAGLVYGLPNRLSEPRLLSPDMPWTGAFNVGAYARIVRPELLSGAAAPELPAWLRSVAPLGLRGLKLAQSVPLTPTERASAGWTDSVPHDVDDLWEQGATAAVFQTVRDKEYLRWRYDENGGASFSYAELRRGGRLAGLAVTTEQAFRGVQALIVMDWLVRPQEPLVFGALLESAYKRATQLAGVALVLVFALPPFSRQALRLGFWRIPERALPSRMFFCFESGGHSAGETRTLASPRSWHLTFGDSDLV